MSGVNVGTAYLEIVPSAKGFAGKLQGAVGGDMTKAGEKAGKDLAAGAKRSFLPGLGGIAAAAGGMFAASKAIDFFKDANAEARESQKVGAQTAAVLKSTGGAAHLTARQIGNLATAISNKTGVDDEAIQSNENMLLTFTNVRNAVGKGNDIFTQATKTVSDMSAALGQDGKSSAIQLGKALNDPVKGITALQRVGVSFTSSQKDTIKHLVKTGHTMQAQKLILHELNKEFGGSAAAQATPAMKAQVAWSNFKEMIGTALLPVIDRLSTFITSKVIPAMSGFIQGMQNGTGPGGRLAEIIKKVWTAVSTFVGFLMKHKETVVTFVVVLGAMAVAFAVLNAIMAINPISLVVLALAALVTGFIMAYRHSETFRKFVNYAFSSIVTGAKQLWSGLKVAFKWIIDAFMNLAGAIAHGAADAFGWVPGLGGRLKHSAKQFDEWRDSVNRSLDGIHDKKVNITIGVYSSSPDLALALTKHGKGGAGKVRAFARGTNSAPGGLSLIGEEGPELMDVPRGARIIPNHALGTALGGRGSQEVRGILSIDRDGVAYIHGVAKEAVGAGSAQAQQAQRRSSDDGLMRR